MIKPLYWVGQSKKDLLAQPGCLKLLRTIKETHGEPSTPSCLKMPFMCCIFFRKNQYRVKQCRSQMLHSFTSGSRLLRIMRKDPDMQNEIEAGSGNVYTDLGYANAEEMQLKAQLAMAIHDILQERGLTQQQAARILGMTQPKLSNLLRGQFRGISEAKMLDCLTRLGRDVDIVVGKAQTIPGTMKVVFG